VKALQTLDIALPPSSGRTSTTIVCTVSSDGKIHVYDLDHIPSRVDKVVEIAPVAEYDSKGTRLTCVTLGDGEVLGGVDGQVNGKRKREDDEEGGDESVEEDGFGSGWEDEGEVGGEEEVEDEEDAEVEEEEESEG